eukprot:gene12717-14022_t
MSVGRGLSENLLGMNQFPGSFRKPPQELSPGKSCCKNMRCKALEAITLSSLACNMPFEGCGDVIGLNDDSQVS